MNGTSGFKRSAAFYFPIIFTSIWSLCLAPSLYLRSHRSVHERQRKAGKGF